MDVGIVVMSGNLRDVMVSYWPDQSCSRHVISHFHHTLDNILHKNYENLDGSENRVVPNKILGLEERRVWGVGT